MPLGFVSGRAANIGRVIDLHKKNAEILLHNEVPARVLEQLVLDRRELLALLGDLIPVDLDRFDNDVVHLLVTKQNAGGEITV